MSERLNIGLIGCGRAAERLYVPAFAQAPEVSLVAAVDSVEERRRLVAEQVPGCTAYGTLSDAMSGRALAAVVIATPPHTHVPIAIEALRLGLAVLVEKPLAPTPAGLDELAAAAEGRTLAVGYNRRFWRPVVQLRDALHSAGDVRGAQATLVMSSDASAWGALSGVPDPLDDLGSHQLDLLRFVFGREIERVTLESADAHRTEFHVELSGGIRARCTAAQADMSQERIEVVAGGRRFVVRLGSERAWPAGGVRRRGLDVLDGVHRRVVRQKSSHKRSYSLQLQAFAALVRCGDPGRLATLADGAAVVRVIDQARRSVERQATEPTGSAAAAEKR